jgi:uncharacterized protein
MNMTPETVSTLVFAVAGWVEREPDLRALAVAGSWARGTAQPDSDCDLLILTTRLARFRGDTWLGALGLEREGFRIIACEPAVYGMAQSWHLQLEPGDALELCFADTSWAAADPVDPGTRWVITDGLRTVVDKDGGFRRLVSALAADSVRLPPAPWT